MTLDNNNASCSQYSNVCIMNDVGLTWHHYSCLVPVSFEFPLASEINKWMGR